MEMIKRRIKKILYRLYLDFWKIAFMAVPVNQKKVVIINYHGKGYGDNAKYIVEALHRMPDISINRDFEIVWLVRKDLYDKVELPYGIRKATYGTVEGLYEMASSKVWLSNCRNMYSAIKKKNQYYIQTWHACLSLKLVEKAAEDKLSFYYVRNAKRDARYTDLMISNSKTCTRMYYDSFWYSKEVLECGSPRNDILINYTEQDVVRLREKLGIEQNVKVILYAPTFRLDGSLDHYIKDYEGLIDSFENYNDADYIVLVRLHPIISNMEIGITGDKVINVTDYDDMQELMVVSDYLISDYSSTAIEFSMMRKPSFLYMEDFDEYQKERGSFFSMDELPYVKAYSEKELFQKIRYFDNTDYLKRLRSFFDHVQLNETGHAASAVAERIRDCMFGVKT